jgi:glucose/arabinose dehydrogenase
LGARIREVDQGPGGEIYLLEDESGGGRMLRLRQADLPTKAEQKNG